MAHCQAIGSKVNESPAAITRFNEAKRKNVEDRKVCGPDRLVLYREPEARPAKAVVPALGDDQSESGYSTSMDGLDGVLRGWSFEQYEEMSPKEAKARAEARLRRQTAAAARRVAEAGGFAGLTDAEEARRAHARPRFLSLSPLTARLGLSSQNGASSSRVRRVAGARGRRGCTAHGVCRAREGVHGDRGCLH